MKRKLSSNHIYDYEWVIDEKNILYAEENFTFNAVGERPTYTYTFETLTPFEGRRSNDYAKAQEYLRKYCDFDSKKDRSSPNIVPKRILHSGPCTIVFWEDGTKTIVRLSENDIYDEYQAFCAALAIKLYGSNSHLKKVIRDKWEER